MEHYRPKRRVPVTLWSPDLRGVEGHVFLDLDPAGHQHQTVLARLNEASRFLPVASGPQGRIELHNKARLVRVTADASALQSDVFTRGFAPWREEEAEVWLCDSTAVSGRVWMPLERPTQRISDFMNQNGWEFFVLLVGQEVQLVNAAAVVRMGLTECAGAPLASRDSRIVTEPSWPVATHH